MELAVFIIAAAIVLTGALGVVLRRHPVHAALSLVQTLFGVAVLFVVQEAHFLAAVQVIVYAGAIVVLFLFVIMLLGVDSSDNLETEPLAGQRPMAAIAGLALLGGLLVAVLTGTHDITGVKAQSAALDGSDNLNLLARSLFSDYVFAFEITSVLVVIAVVGAVILARKPPRSLTDVSGDANAR
jgi:NADH-quinone oxidoreductase subunit J